MSKAKYLQFIASFLILLVINLAIYVPAAYATINSVSVRGNDGVEGFARADDALTFTASVSLPSSQTTNQATNQTSNKTTTQSTQTIQITKDQVVLVSNNVFDSCSVSNDGTICTLKYPANGTAAFQSKILPYTIKFYKDAARTQLDDSRSSNFIVDNQPPQLKLEVSKGLYSGQENVVVNYEIIDSACEDPACTNICSGIKSLELHSSDNSFKQTVAINKKDCTYKSSLNIESKKFKSGKVTLIGTAIDAVNKVSPESAVAFTVDSTPPDIIENSFAIKRKGIPITTYSPFVVGVEVSVDISGNDLDTGSVTGDFTPLNPSVADAKAACSAKKTNLFMCKWLFELTPPAQNSVTGNVVANSTTSTSTASDATSSTTTPAKNPNAIIITASDILGNKATSTITKTLTLDDKGPVVQSLVTSYVKGDKFFARRAGNVIIAAFTDASGVSEDGAILHVDGSAIPATTCTKVANSVCTWQNINFNSDQSTISIEQDTTDILLNPVSEAKKTDVVVDSKPPVVNKINVTPVGTISDSIIDLFKIGDKLSIVANVTEENDLSAYGDFSRFVEKAKRVQGTCARIDSTTQLCKWLTDAVSIEGSGQLKFLFNDTVDNHVSAVQDLNVLGLEPSAPPDFWDSKVSCSPKSVDRQLGTFINQRVYCEVKLIPKVQGVSTLLISQPECKGDGTKLVQSIEAFNVEKGSTSPLVKITLKKDPLKINEAELNCSFNIISRIGDRVTKNPEKESSNLSIEFYNLPLGEVSENVQNKIDETKNDIRNLNNYIGTFKKIFDYAKKICQLWGIIYNLVVIKYTITITKKVAADISAGSIVGSPATPGLALAGGIACNTQQQAESEAGKGWKTSGGKFCKFVNCQWSPGILGDWRNFMQNELNKMPGVEWLPQGAVRYQKEGEFQAAQVQGGLAGMDPNNNLFVAVAFGCIPGIISGLDKFRQIKCLYADCLINAVAKDGLPPTSCEDLKKYTTCKYIWGEIFAILPYTAAFDYITGIVKEALSNPFSAFGLGISAFCEATCHVSPPVSAAAYIGCEAGKIFSKFGEVIGNVRNIYQGGFGLNQDYCSRIDLEEEQQSSSQTNSSSQSSSSTQTSSSSPQSSSANTQTTSTNSQTNNP